MSVSNFLERLKALVPDKANLQEIFGYYFMDQANAFSHFKKDSQSLSNNMIIQLIDEYDCTSLGLVSNISFNKELRGIEKFVLFGWLRGEYLLAIDKKGEKLYH